MALFLNMELSNNFCRSTPHRKSDRFVVNLYESPLRKSVSKTKSSINKLNRLCSLYDKSDNKKNICCDANDEFYIKKLTMDQFFDLKNRRDVECLKMKEASNLLQYLNAYSPYEFWQERLLAEKVLLECGRHVEVLRRKISRDYASISEIPVPVGTVSLTDFNFHLTDELKNQAEFFILLLTCGTNVIASEIVKMFNGKIIFDGHFTFPVVLGFKIEVQLYSITMKQSPKLYTLTRHISLKNRESCPFFKIQYKNLNTSSYEEIIVMKSSFRLRAETEINDSNLSSTQLTLNSTSTASAFVNFTAKMDKLEIGIKRCGFLTLGLPFKDMIVWNRRWCVLNGNFLDVYASPVDVDFGKVCLRLDLVNCLTKEIIEAQRSECCRPRSFAISVNDNKYFFMADCRRDLEVWLDDLNLVLDIIKSRSRIKQ